ncbi:hypothetical protein ACIGW8_06190 [Streptomyces sioyaensis]|uniref:hypothetical protein n=1 Tax=Streptomyces sioyaensis TaxID=67364 RepID=UPI0037D2A75C
MEVQRLYDGPESPAYLYLAPEAAHGHSGVHHCRGRDRPGDTDRACNEGCEVRTECHRAAIADLFRSAEPATATADEEPAPDKETLFLEARELAGRAANLDDVLKLAHYLAA